MNVRFGAFEVDLEGRRLLKRGMPITLREQSFPVLAALMERPGEIVTREELRQRLWSPDTFVDFEVALNSAVRRLLPISIRTHNLLVPGSNPGGPPQNPQGRPTFSEISISPKLCNFEQSTE